MPGTGLRFPHAAQAFPIGDGASSSFAISCVTRSQYPLVQVVNTGPNLAANGSFEQGLTGYDSNVGLFLNGSSVLTQSSAHAQFGTYSAQVANPGVGTREGIEQALPLSKVFLSGVSYVFSAYLLGAAGGEPLILAWGVLGDNVQSSGFTLTTGWQRFSSVWTPSANRTGVKASVRSNGGAVALTFFVDGFQVEQASTPSTFTDGTGTVEDASVSMLAAPQNADGGFAQTITVSAEAWATSPPATNSLNVVVRD